MLAGAWANMCIEFADNGLKPIKWGFECEAMTFLEHHNFIVTQEPEKRKRKLIVKIKGHYILKGQHFFCTNLNKHLEKD